MDNGPFFKKKMNDTTDPDKCQQLRQPNDLPEEGTVESLNAQPMDEMKLGPKKPGEGEKDSQIKIQEKDKGREWLSVEEDPSLKRVLVNVLKFIGFMIWAQIPASSMLVLNTRSKQLPLPLVATLTLVVVIFTAWSCRFIWRAYYQRAEGKDDLGPLKWKDVGVAFLYFIGLRIFVIVVSLLNQLLFGANHSANDQIILQSIHQGTLPLTQIPFYIVLALVAPFLEELVFRGLFQRLFFKTQRFYVPLLFSSLLFGGMHASANPIEASMYIGMGVALYLAYHRRRNIKDSILLHVLNNGTVVIFLFIIYLMKVAG